MTDHKLCRLSPLLIFVLLCCPAVAQEPLMLKGHTDRVTSVAFSPDNKTLVSAGKDKTIRLWNPTTGKLLATLTDAKPNGRAVAFSPDGHRLAGTCGGFYSSPYSQVVIWDAETRKPLYSMPTAYIQDAVAVAFSADGARLATGAVYPHGGWSLRGEPDVRKAAPSKSGIGTTQRGFRIRRR